MEIKTRIVFRKNNGIAPGLKLNIDYGKLTGTAKANTCLIFR
jgi:hypothetical protein